MYFKHLKGEITHLIGPEEEALVPNERLKIIFSASFCVVSCQVI